MPLKISHMEAINLICLTCKHLRTISGGCDAFPGDIPDEIVGGWNKHRKPLPGQKNNIVYEEGERLEDLRYKIPPDRHPGAQ